MGFGRPRCEKSSKIVGTASTPPRVRRTPHRDAREYRPSPYSEADTGAAAAFLARGLRRAPAPRVAPAPSAPPAAPAPPVDGSTAFCSSLRDSSMPRARSQRSGTVSRQDDQAEVDVAQVAHHRDVERHAVGDGAHRVEVDQLGPGRVEREVRPGHIGDRHVEDGSDPIGDRGRRHSRPARAATAGGMNSVQSVTVLIDAVSSCSLAALVAPLMACSRSTGSSMSLASETSIADTWLPRLPCCSSASATRRAPSPAGSRRAARPVRRGSRATPPSTPPGPRR